MTDSNGSKPRVALIGLGAMGAGMAGRLLAAKFPTTLYNRSRTKAEAFAKSGALIAVSPREAAQKAQVVISMVADDNASREVWLGASGALASVNAGSLLIECSTLSGEWVMELARAAAERNCEFLDAPVTGSKPQAQAGELLFLVGGEAAAVERARPVLLAMGRGLVHLGPTGSGSLMKLINNFLCGVQTASMAEALAWIEAAKLDRAQAVSVLTQGAPGSPIVRRTAERLEQNDFAPAFTLRLMAKDLTYAIEEAARSGADLQTALTPLQRFHDAAREGFGEKDFSAVTLSVRNKVGKPTT